MAPQETDVASAQWLVVGEHLHVQKCNMRSIMPPQKEAPPTCCSPPVGGLGLPL